MKKQIVIPILLMIICSFQLQAQNSDVLKVTKDAQSTSSILDEEATNPWSWGAGFQLTISQAYSKNWVGAANPSIGGAILGNMFVKYAKNKLAWENTLDLDYGQKVTFNPPEPKGIGTKMEKISDKLDFKSKFGYKAGNSYWFYGTMFTLSTQLTNGYDPNVDTILTSKFMTPGYITFSLGMDYKREKWSWYISPIGAKITTKLASDTIFTKYENFGVEAGKKIYAAFGASTHLIFAADIHPKINLNTKLELFYDYLGEYTQLRNLDVRFDMVWMFNITDWLSLSFKMALLYDYDVKFKCYDDNGLLRYTIRDGKQVELETDHLQFQEYFGLTLGYKFKLPK